MKHAFIAILLIALPVAGQDPDIQPAQECIVEGTQSFLEANSDPPIYDPGYRVDFYALDLVAWIQDREIQNPSLIYCHQATCAWDTPDYTDVDWENCVPEPIQEQMAQAFAILASCLSQSSGCPTVDCLPLAGTLACLDATCNQINVPCDIFAQVCQTEIMLPSDFDYQDQDGDGIAQFTLQTEDTSHYLCGGPSNTQTHTFGDPDDNDPDNPIGDDRCQAIAGRINNAYHPTTASIEDRDEDDLHAVWTQDGYYELHPDCTITTTVEDESQHGPDPDDTQPHVIGECLPFDLDIYTLPTVQDNDKDNLPIVRINAYRLYTDEECNIQQDAPREVTQVAVDNDDETPLINGTELTHLSVPCGINDDDGDRVVEVLRCTHRVRVEDGTISTQQTGFDTSLGDPDDRDRCNPIPCVITGGQTPPTAEHSNETTDDQAEDLQGFSWWNDGAIPPGIFLPFLVVALMLIIAAGRRK